MTTWKASPEARARAVAAGYARAKAFIDEVNARTVCAHCGKQPIQWHNPEHVELGLEKNRISRMSSRHASIATIAAEMARCTPLCARCHMVEDGRLRAFIAQSQQPRQLKPPVPCRDCGKLIRQASICNACNHRQRYYRKTEDGENEPEWTATQNEAAPRL